MKQTTIDGVPVVAEAIDPESGALAGRSLLLAGDALPAVHTHGAVPGPGDRMSPEVAEMLAGRWWPEQIEDWREWTMLGDEARWHAVGRGPQLAVGPNETLRWSTDPSRLRAPYPPQLISAATSEAGTGPPFTGPRIGRHWVQPLQPAPGATHGSWTVDTATGVRETYASLTGVGAFSAELMTPNWPVWNARVDLTDRAVAVTCNYKDVDPRGNLRPGAEAMTWLIPISSIARIQVTTTWDNMIPMVGARRKIIAELVEARGYGPMTSGQIALVYSDGWRVLAMTLLVGEKYSHDERPLLMNDLGERGFADLVNGIITSVNAAQAGSLSWPGSTPTPISTEVARSVRRDDDIQPRMTDTIVSDRAVHWAIPIAADHGLSAPSPSARPPGQPGTNPSLTAAPHRPPPPPPPQAVDAIPEPYPEPDQLAVAAGGAALSCLGGILVGAVTLLVVGAVSMGALLLLSSVSDNPGWGLVGFFTVWAVFFLYSGISDFRDATRQGRLAAQYGYRDQRSSASWQQLSALRTIVPGVLAAGLAFVSMLLATGVGT